MLYLSIFSLMVILRYACLGNRKLLLEVYPLVLGFLFLFVSFRFEVGCDWPQYKLEYENFGIEFLGRDLTFLEPSYWLTMKILHLLDLSYVWINVVYAAIFFYGVGRLAKHQQDPLAMIILMFPILIMNMPMAGIRQGAAIGIMCISYLAFIDKKLWKYPLSISFFKVNA